MKVIIAPDSFKGSLSAADAARAIAGGVRRAAPQAAVEQLPLADGGEGTVAALVQAAGGRLESAVVHDPIGRERAATFGLLRDDVAAIEMAAASGLPLLSHAERDPFGTGTRGTGELLRAALDHGVREIILGVGGSATVDGGAGALQALGARLLDAAGAPIGVGNAGLATLASIDLDGLDPRIRRVRLRVACDVQNPLTGPHGAAAVFGPQKGARPSNIAALDAHLAHFASIVRRDLGIDVSTAPGSGAAGGLTAGLLAIGATIEPGIDLVMSAMRFEEYLDGADLVITGEGRIDRQTMHGKVISGVLARARPRRVPVIALAGAVRHAELRPLYRAGLVAALAIETRPMSLRDAHAEAAHLLEQTAESALRLWLAARRAGR